MNYKLKPALMLDLDGTVRRCKSGNTFIRKLDDIELMPGIEKILWIYAKMKWVIIGVSNQGGVAHGFKTPEVINDELDKMLWLFTPTAVDYSGESPTVLAHPFDFLMTCYHEAKGNVEPYNHRSLMRKPSYGMLAMAEVRAFEIKRVIIDWDNSLMVGDRPEDEECARGAQVKYKDIKDFLSESVVFEIRDGESAQYPL